MGEVSGLVGGELAGLADMTKLPVASFFRAVPTLKW
jgi:hypothetical protein